MTNLIKRILIALGLYAPPAPPVESVDDLFCETQEAADSNLRAAARKR